MHRIIPIDEAYMVRAAYCSNIIDNIFPEKKNQLLSYMQTIDFRMEEIKRVKNNIEKDIKLE